MKLINTKNKCFFVIIILTTNDFIYLFIFDNLFFKLRNLNVNKIFGSKYITIKPKESKKA